MGKHGNLCPQPRVSRMKRRIEKSGDLFSLWMETKTPSAWGHNYGQIFCNDRGLASSRRRQVHCIVLFIRETTGTQNQKFKNSLLSSLAKGPCNQKAFSCIKKKEPPAAARRKNLHIGILHLLLLRRSSVEQKIPKNKQDDEFGRRPRSRCC